MSDAGRGAGPRAGAPGGQGDGPSEAEVRAYLERLRTAPVEAVVVELVEALASAVQVKLGRPDARVLLDLLAAVAGAVDGRVEAALGASITDALTQLRLAQVEAERQLGGEAPTAEPAGAEAEVPPVGTATAPPTAPGRPQAASRLWVPGR